MDAFQEQLRERNAKIRMKRKAEEDLNTETKRPAFDAPPATRETKTAPAPPKSVAEKSSKVAIKYPNGALRITRTPGRRNAKNCVNLQDVIHKEQLTSACIFSFFIGGEELYQHLPFSHSSDTVPIYIGRDANMDPMIQEACNQAGLSFKEGKLTNIQLQSLTPVLREIYIMEHGQNYHAFYAWSPGSSHSKILVLVYSDFLRLVITSCNMMDIDTLLGDNHWYIHDMPKLASKSKSTSAFESDLLAHLQALGTPTAFIESIRGGYDYSKVKVHLVTSVPGVKAGANAEKHGLLRLRRVIHDLDLKLDGKESEELRLEICAASIGNLNAKWLNGFNDCALGKKTIKIAEDRPVPQLKLFYPSVGDVKKADASAQEAASNIGCHTRPWDNAAKEIKDIFHHYESKDIGRLFHQKLIMAYNPGDKNKDQPPYYVYVGSANLSQSAWGALEQDKKKNKETCDTKLVKLGNFECGVVVPGHLIKGLLEEGTGSWQDGIVPYVQTGKKYDLSKDRPWNDPRWVQGY